MKFRLLFLFTFFTYTAISQQTKVAWGETVKRQLYIRDFLPGNGKNIIKIEADEYERNCSLTLYNNALSQKAINEDIVQDKNAELVNAISTNGSLYVFTSLINKDDGVFDYYAQKINKQTLKTEGANMLIGSIKRRKNYALPMVSFLFSQDSSKILLFCSGPDVTGENEDYLIAVFNSAMQPLWKKNIEIPYESIKMEELTPFVTNEGEVGIPINIYEKNIRKPELVTEGIRLPAYISKLFIYAKNSPSPKEVSVNLEGKYLHTFHLINDDKNDLTFFGLYKNKSGGNTAGFFTSAPGIAGTPIKVAKFNNFSPSLLSLIKTDSQGSDGSSDPGISVEFYLKEILKRKNGSTDYILQLSNSRTTGGNIDFRSNGTLYTTHTYTVHKFEDIIDINVNTAGNITFTRIPRSIHHSTDRFGDAIVVVHENKILFFYNDDSKNLAQDFDKAPNMLNNAEKSDFVMAAIDEKGKLTRTVLYEHRNMKNTTHVQKSNKLNNNQIALYASDPRLSNYVIGSLEIQ